MSWVLLIKVTIGLKSFVLQKQGNNIISLSNLSDFSKTTVKIFLGVAIFFIYFKLIINPLILQNEYQIKRNSMNLQLQSKIFK